MEKKHIVALTGAGVSAESGLSTFRDSGGLWEKHDIMEVATPQAWELNPELVMEFYNQRRKQLYNVKPNAAHYSLAELQRYFKVDIVTQNVDDLHEAAGSLSVMHLHGELKKVRSTVDESLVYSLEGWELKIGDLCEKGSQLRPHIVWFGEAVEMIPYAAELVEKADILLIVGTSLNVYPAAGLVSYAQPGVPVYLIDPGHMDVNHIPGITIIKDKAGSGMPKLAKILIEQYA